MHSSRRRPRPAERRARRRRPAPRPWLPFRLLARALVGVLVPLLGVTWLLGSHNVTLQIDGQPQTVMTHARTVDELLDRMGIEYSPDDELLPPPATQLRDGMVVELVHAREITLLVGGETNTVLVTALSVDEVIQQLRSRQQVSQRAIVRPSRLMPVTAGMTVEVLNPVPVTVVADGKAREVVTDATSVFGVLQRLGLELNANDRVTPSSGADVEAGMRIVVERVVVRTVEREVALPFHTEERTNDQLPQGEEREIQSGRDGHAVVTERVTVVDGAEESRRELKRQVLQEAQTRIIEVGTAAPPAAEPAEPEDDASSSTSESSDRASSPDPSPASSEDGRSQTGQASYYQHPEEGMTAAHRTLPFGTVVTVTNRANGKSVQVTINDRGPFIEGRIIDLNTEAFERIAATATGVIDVRISW